MKLYFCAIFDLKSTDFTDWRISSNHMQVKLEKMKSFCTLLYFIFVVFGLYHLASSLIIWLMVWPLTTAIFFSLNSSKNLWYPLAINTPSSAFYISPLLTVNSAMCLFSSILLKKLYTKDTISSPTVICVINSFENSSNFNPEVALSTL